MCSFQETVKFKFIYKQPTVLHNQNATEVLNLSLLLYVTNVSILRHGSKLSCSLYLYGGILRSSF